MLGYLTPNALFSSIPQCIIFLAYIPFASSFSLVLLLADAVQVSTSDSPWQVTLAAPRDLLLQRNFSLARNHLPAEVRRV